MEWLLTKEDKEQFPELWEARRAFGGFGKVAQKIISTAARAVRKTKVGINSLGRKKTINELTRDISGYATIGGTKECFAEAICDVIANGEQDAVFSKEIFSLASKKYEELLGGKNSVQGERLIQSATPIYRNKDKTQRKSGQPGYTRIDKATYHRIVNPAIKQGADIRIADEEEGWKEHLEKMNATAVSIGNVIYFRRDASTSGVLEEVHHFYQNRNHLNDDKDGRLRIILNEIDAKQYLIRNRKKYKIPDEEDSLTRHQLDLKLE